MSLPQPLASAIVQNTRALAFLSPSTQTTALPPPQFSPGAHLNRDEAFALKRPGEEADTRPSPRVLKKPKHSRRPSDAPTSTPLPTPPPAAAAAPAATASSSSAADTPISRFNLWLNANRLPMSPPPDWPGDKAHWESTALDEFKWMKGEVKSGGSNILGEAWNQLRASPDPDEDRIRMLVARAFNIRRRKAGRGQAVFPRVRHKLHASGETTTTKDGKVAFDLTLDDTPEPEEPVRPVTCISSSPAPAVPLTRPPLPSHPSAPASLTATLKVPQPPLASPESGARPDSAPPTMPVIRPPAVRARIANPLQRASPNKGEAAEATRVPSQPVVYGTESVTLPPQLSASPFLVPPTATVPSLSPPLLPPGQPSSTAPLQPPAAVAVPPPPNPPPVLSLTAPHAQPATSSLPSVPSILLPAASRERTVSRKEQPKVTMAEIKSMATRAATETHRDFSAAMVEQRARQRSARDSDEYSPLRPTLELPTLEPVSTARTNNSTLPTDPIEEAQCYTIGPYRIPLAMYECFLLWNLQYGQEQTSKFIANWGTEIGLQECELRTILTALIAVSKCDNPGREEMQRRQRVSMRHLARVAQKREREEMRRAGASLSAQQEQQQALVVGAHQQQQQGQQQRQHPRIAQAPTHFPGRGAPTIGDSLSQQTHHSCALAAQSALQQQQLQRDYDAHLTRHTRRASSGGSPILAGSPTFAARAPVVVRRASDSQARVQGPSNYIDHQYKSTQTSTHPPSPSSRPRTAEHSAPPPPASAQFGPSISPISPTLSPHLAPAPIPSQRHSQQQQQQHSPAFTSPTPADLLLAALRPMLGATQAFVIALDNGEIGRGGVELERRWNSRLKAIEEGERKKEKKQGQQLVGPGLRSEGASVS